MWPNNQLSIPTSKSESCYNISFQSDVNVSDADHFSVETSTVQLSCNISVIKENDAKEENPIITEPLTLISLPTELLELILKHLSFENMANLRRVCQRFNSICTTVLNSEFNRLRALLQNKFLGIKAQMPRRESARRKHPMARESDIIETLHMRLSLLQMTFGKHIERKHCCFFPGEILDEVYRIIKYVEMTPNLSRAYKVTDELFDLSTMAMEYFKEHIEPNLPEIAYFAADFLDYPPSISSSPNPQVSFFEESLSSMKCTGIINPEPLVESAAVSLTSPVIDRSIKRLKGLFKKNNNQIQAIKLAQQLSSKKNASTQKEIHQLKLKLKRYEKKFPNVSRKLDCALNELNKCKTELEFFRSNPSCSHCHKNDSWKKLQIHILNDDDSEKNATKTFKRKLGTFRNYEEENMKCKRLHPHTQDSSPKKARNEEMKCKCLQMHKHGCSPEKASSHNTKSDVTKCKKLQISCLESHVTSSSKKVKIKRPKKSVQACKDKAFTRVTRSSTKYSSYDSTWSFSNSLPKFPPYLIIAPLKYSLELYESMGRELDESMGSSFIDSTAFDMRNGNSSCFREEKNYSNFSAEDSLLEHYASLQEQVLPNPVYNILCTLEESPEEVQNITCSFKESPEPGVLQKLEVLPNPPEKFQQSPSLTETITGSVLLSEPISKSFHTDTYPNDFASLKQDVHTSTRETPLTPPKPDALQETSTTEIPLVPCSSIPHHASLCNHVLHVLKNELYLLNTQDKTKSKIKVNNEPFKVKELHLSKKVLKNKDSCKKNKSKIHNSSLEYGYNQLKKHCSSVMNTCHMKSDLTRKKISASPLKDKLMKSKNNNNGSISKKASKQCSSENELIKRSQSTMKQVHNAPSLKRKMCKRSVRKRDNLDCDHKKKSKAYGVRDTNVRSDYYSLYRNNILYIRPPTFLKHLKI